MAMAYVGWTPAAAVDLEIHDYLVENYPHLAHSTITKLYQEHSVAEK